MAGVQRADVAWDDAVRSCKAPSIASGRPGSALDIANEYAVHNPIGRDESAALKTMMSFRMPVANDAEAASWTLHSTELQRQPGLFVRAIY
jgi:hypothetical protein